MEEKTKHIAVPEKTHKMFKDLAREYGQTLRGYMEHLAKHLDAKFKAKKKN